jgi:hypothetical protein
MVANTPRTVVKHPRTVRETSENPNDFNAPCEAPLPSAMKPKREEKRREERYIEEANASSHPKPAAWGGFEDFWRAYPNKVGKDAAKRKFDALRKSGRVEFADLMGGLERYKASKPPDREWCHPTTWLNQGRWQDQPAEVSSFLTTINGACNVQPLSQKRKLSDAIADAKIAYGDLYGVG